MSKEEINKIIPDTVAETIANYPAFTTALSENFFETSAKIQSGAFNDDTIKQLMSNILQPLVELNTASTIVSLRKLGFLPVDLGVDCPKD